MTNKPRISVALCTFNGGQYLSEQLTSIAAQRLLPFELVVCDDGSTDETLEVVSAFARCAPFPVRIYRNPLNLGYVKNFEQAMRYCAGEIIALSDQDDVWRPEKLQCFAQLFAAQPQADLVFCDGEVVDAALNPLGYRVWTRVGFRSRHRHLLQVDSRYAMRLLLKRCVVAGSMMAFRASLLKSALPVPLGWAHDHWLAFISAVFSDLAYIDTPLVDYRQHERQSSGGVKPFNLSRRLSRPVEGTVAMESALRHFAQMPETERAREIRALMRKKLRHQAVRATLPAHRALRVPVVLRELVMLRYTRFSNGVLSAVKDCLR